MKISEAVRNLQETLNREGDLEIYTIQHDNCGWPYFEEAEVEVYAREEKDVGSPHATGHSRRHPAPLPMKFILVA